MPNIEDFLPTKLQKWIWGTTVTLTLGVPFLSDGLQKLGLKIEWLEDTKIRLLLGAGAFSIGMFALNISLLVHLHALEKRPKSPVSRPVKPFIPKRLAPIDNEILKLLSINTKPMLTRDIAHILQVLPALAEYHLTELDASGHVYEARTTMGESRWKLQQIGRAHLVNAGLLK